MFSVQGIVKSKAKEITGTNKSGHAYRIGQVLVEYGDVNTNKTYTMALKIFGDLNDTIQIGFEYNFAFIIDSREYNGKFYTDAIADKAIEMPSNGAVDRMSEESHDDGEFAAGPPASTRPGGSPASFVHDDKDDLPF